MKRHVAVFTLPLLMLALTGCIRSAQPAPVEPDTADTAACLTLSAGASEALQHGLDEVWPNQSILNTAAIATPDGDTWFVAATVDSQGDEVEAVWYTVNDPTEAGDNAYLSVDAVAETISYYARPDGASITMDGAQQALDCLT